MLWDIYEWYDKLAPGPRLIWTLFALSLGLGVVFSSSNINIQIIGVGLFGVSCCDDVLFCGIQKTRTGETGWRN